MALTPGVLYGGLPGSGLGTYIVALLEDEYPDIYRFNAAVFPSERDDVVTSPYNSILALRELNEHADCVLPIHNQALLNICTRIQVMYISLLSRVVSAVHGIRGAIDLTAVARPRLHRPHPSGLPVEVKHCEAVR